MGRSFWLTRGVLPLLAALAAVPVLSPPVDAVSKPAAEWWLNALGARQAWASAPQEGAGVTVAVLSTGTEGSAVASLITGIAPKARTLPVRVTYNGKNSLPDGIAQGIGYAVSQGATVIDLPRTASGSAAEQAAVRNAIAHNVVMVAPAGDTGQSGVISYPAAYPGVIAVGAADSTGKLAPYSAAGSYVTLTAPGDNIKAGTPGSGSATLSSTGASAALIAGITALVRSRYPRLSASQITQALKDGAAPMPGTQSGTGAGEANAAATLTAASSITSLNGAPLPPAAPAWQQYAKNGNATSGSGLLSTRHLVEAGIAAGVLILAAVIAIVAIVRRRRRRPDNDGLVWSYPAELPAPAPVPPRRVSAADALTRNTRFRVPPQAADPNQPAPHQPRRHHADPHQVNPHQVNPRHADPRHADPRHADPRQVGPNPELPRRHRR